MLKSADPTFVIAKPYYWSIIEINVAILAASLPSFKPLVKRFLPRLLGSSRGRSGSPGYGSSGSASRSRSASFNKLAGKGRKKQTSDNSSGTYNYHDTKWDMKTPLASHIGREVELISFENPSAQSGIARHSNESEEHIVRKPSQNKGQILRTVEFSRSEEYRDPRGDQRSRADHYPGYAV